ncbi:MAG TPA: nucleoside monophosphate kinase [Candidatus Acidoferrum sp.]|nr:nucleoside monophosphate kinase [Candidatus Acidoferrum sp.]
MSISSKPTLIGLSGTFASGKDTLATHLAKQYHYLHISTGDILRHEAMRLRGSTERPVMREVADELRHTKSPSYLVELALQAYTEHQDRGKNYNGAIISGLRSLGEAKAIKKAGGVMLFVDAPFEVRYHRMLSRQRDNETQVTLEHFKQREASEMSSELGDDAGFNLQGIRDMSDLVLINHFETPEQFFEEVIDNLHLAS